MEQSNTNKQHIQVKLIFNPNSGANDKSPAQLMEAIKEMQAVDLVPEIYMTNPEYSTIEAVKDAIDQGFNMIVACGGDGTISAVAKALVGTNATLGIIPTGTQNNIALSLGIPTDIHDAVAIIRNGHKTKLDIGIISCGDKSTPFMEICSIGLFSTLFPSGDEIQHGNIARIGDFLATLATSPPSEIHLLLDDKKEIKETGQIVLITNMPYAGRNYQVGEQNSYNDGLLDVLFFTDQPKLVLLDYIIKGSGASTMDDNRIQHFRVQKVRIDTQPAMPVMADGKTIGEGHVEIEVQKHALAVMIKCLNSD